MTLYRDRFDAPRNRVLNKAIKIAMKSGALQRRSAGNDPEKAACSPQTETAYQLPDRQVGGARAYKPADNETYLAPTCA